MADVTVGELAKVVGVTTERLLAQIKEAGLPHKRAEEPISNEDKNTLLLFLRRSHGAAASADASPKKITLKRKTVETLKTASGQGRGKTVSVEVRKKRTYVKRSELQPEKPAEEELIVPPEAPNQEIAAEPAVEATTDSPAEESGKDADAVRKDAATEVSPTETSDAAEPEKAPAAETAETKPAAPVADVPAQDPDSAKPGRGKAKPAAKSGRKADTDDKDEEKKSGFRKKAVAGKKPGKARIDDFVLEDGEFDDGGRGRRGGPRKKSRNKQHGFEKPTEFISREITIGEANTVGDLAQKMSVKSAELIKALFKMGVMATINQALDQDTATLLIEEMGHTAKFVSADAIEDDLYESLVYEGGDEAITRAPVVTVMGHVDHGKTSLLDFIRKESVAAGEAGGITQHIGAYHVETDHGMVSFLDTPGHAAFTAMRARGAQCTDIVVLVVAADDGVMPQTKEAVQHARSAGVPIVVAINKMDKEEADPDRVKTELAGMEVIPEDWGGDVQFVPVSAHTGEGIEDLLEALLLQAEVLELEAATDAPAKGVVVESSLERGRGSVATVLVQNGTLRQGDMVVAGSYFGKVRAMTDEAGKQVKEAGPSIPVEILGLNGTPDAGDEFFAVADEKKAKELAEFRQSREREQRLQRQQAAKLENLFENMGKDEVKTLNVVLKTDVRGSLEAITKALQDLGNDEVQVKIVSSGVGGIAETDVSLAMATNAVIFGFNVRADTASKRLVEQEGLDLRYYSIIYNLIDDVKAALTGMLAPEFREDIVGIADVRDVFRSPKFGQVAGCMVTEGTVYRNKPIRVLRDNVVIFEGELESLRRFKDDVPEVRNG
ncbi:MAG TPA: translation initiation factor IF-2, partial [Marinobacter adhaerens]|nr:translation initiation factor IF-2 [Marinobacter adhaerens]